MSAEEKNVTETVVTTAPGRDSLNFDLGVTLKGGVHIPVEIIIVYPEGNGLHAVQALIKAMETQTEGMFQELLNRQDESLIAAMLAKGVHVEYEDDEL